MTRRLLALLLATAGASCADGVAPGGDERVGLLFSLQAPAAVSPAESDAISDAFDLVDTYIVTVQDSVTGATLALDTVSVGSGGDQHEIDIALPSATVGLTALLTVVGRDGTQELYRTSAYVRIQDETTATPVALGVRYTGPGIRGTLATGTGAPIADADVDLMQGNNLIASVTTEDDGTYLFLGVAAGLYQIQPTAPLGQFVCPTTRNVSVQGPASALIADFQTSATPCQIDLLILSGGDLAFAGDTATVSAMFAGMANVNRSTFFFVNTLPTLAYLRQFDVILLFTNGLFDQSSALGSRIEDYVQLGGNLITATFYWQNRTDSGLDAAGWGTLEALDPFTSGGAGQTYQAATLGTVTTGDGVTGDALVAGLTTLTSTGFRGSVAAKAETTVVARWSDNSPLIGYRVLPWGSRIVGIGLFPASGAAATGDVVTLWRNAVGWAGVAGGPN